MTSASPVPVLDQPAAGHPVQLGTVPAPAELLGASRSKLYELLLEGALPAVRNGRSRRIPLTDVDECVRRCRDLGSRAAAQDGLPTEVGPAGMVRV